MSSNFLLKFYYRTALFELVQALKFKISIPDSNFLLMTNLILYDAGGQLFTGANT